MTNSGPDLSSLTFLQREGLEALPSQLAPKTLSRSLIARMWGYIHSTMEPYISRASYGLPPNLFGPWEEVLRLWHVRREHKFADEFDSSFPKAGGRIKTLITNSDYSIFFDFIEFSVRCSKFPDDWAMVIAYILVDERAAYRLVEKTIVPVTSPESGQAVVQALKSVAAAGAPAASEHLLAAGRELTAGAWAESIRQSINAVESAARLLDPDSTTLGPALTNLEKHGLITAPMKRAFGALYGYASQEGIRHAQVFEMGANVGEKEALFMFGSCASFVDYLLTSKRDMKGLTC